MIRLALALTLSLLFVTDATALQRGASTIRVTNRVVTVQRMPAGTMVHRFLLYNKHARAGAIGSSVRICTFLGRRGALGDGADYCLVTYSFPLGTVLAQGIVRNELRFQLVVVGGTGYYANIKYGTVLSQAFADRPLRSLLVFTLNA